MEGAQMTDCVEKHTVYPVYYIKGPASSEMYTLSLHDALPISPPPTESVLDAPASEYTVSVPPPELNATTFEPPPVATVRSEEHTSGTPVTRSSRMPSSA